MFSDTLSITNSLEEEGRKTFELFASSTTQLIGDRSTTLDFNLTILLFFFFFFFYIGTETQLKRSSLLKKETSRSFSSSRKSRSVPDKHLEVLLAADHLYLNKFHSDKEATDLLLTLANIVSTSCYSPRFVVCLLFYLLNHY